jgi:hypothetical protein
MRAATLLCAAGLIAAGGCAVVYGYDGYEEGVAHCDGEGNLVPALDCDGRGECKAPEPRSCFPFSCRDGRCVKSCGGHGGCSASAMCVEGQCMDCRSCWDRIIGDQSAGEDCPGSELIFNSLYQCANDLCVMPCNMEPPDPDACGECLSASCPAETQACFADTGHGL